jgi:hypothetical protein
VALLPLAWLALQAHLLVLGLMSVAWNLACGLAVPAVAAAAGPAHSAAR